MTLGTVLMEEDELWKMASLTDKSLRSKDHEKHYDYLCGSNTVLRAV